MEPWNSSFELGVPAIDKAHRALDALVLEAMAALERGDTKALGAALGVLAAALVPHFREEEAMMTRSKFQGAADAEAHATFLGECPAAGNSQGVGRTLFHLWFGFGSRPGFVSTSAASTRRWPAAFGRGRSRRPVASRPASSRRRSRSPSSGGRERRRRVEGARHGDAIEDDPDALLPGWRPRAVELRHDPGDGAGMQEGRLLLLQQDGEGEGCRPPGPGEGNASARNAGIKGAWTPSSRPAALPRR